MSIFREAIAVNVNLDILAAIVKQVRQYSLMYMLWFKFCFPLFLGMVMYDNEFKTKENKI